MSDLTPRLKEMILGKKSARDVLIPANFGTGSEQQTIDIAKGLVANAPMPGPFADMLKQTAANQDFSHNAQDFGTLTWDSQRNEVTLDSVLCEIAGIESPMIGARLKDFLTLVSEESRESLADSLRRSLQTGKDLECACLLGQDPSRAREVRILGKTLPDASGRATSIVCAVQPKVTLKPPVRQPDTPLAKACHDLRTPLNAIRGYTQMLRRDPLTDRQLECLTKVDTHCNSMLSTIDSELAEQADTKPEHQGFSVFQLVNDVGEMFNATRLPENVSLTWKVEDDNCLVQTDQVKLRRILVNLVDNALKHTQEGEVCISGSVSDDDELKLTVSDTGCGIPPEVMPRIFEPFFRLEQMGGQVGAGLGLAICRDLTKQLDGNIEVDSEPGHGSEFILKVPVVTKANRRQRSPRAGQVKMALVGDRSFHNRCVMETLALQGQAINQYTDFGEISDSDDAQVIMLDCSGNERATKDLTDVRRQAPRSAIVAICDTLDGASADQLLSAGADTLLVKPFLARELTATVESAVKHAEHRRKVKKVSLPRDVARSISEAASRADIDGLEHLIGELENIDHALAGDLKEMTRKLDYDGLLSTVAMNGPHKRGH